MMTISYTVISYRDIYNDPSEKNERAPWNPGTRWRNNMELKFLLDEPHGRFDILKKWLPRVGVALLFIFVGTNKFAAGTEWVGIFDRIGLGQWFRYFTGALQVTGALLVLIPRTFIFGIIILACTMAGAIASWIFLLGEPFNFVFPAALLGGLLFVGGEDLIDFVAVYRKPSG